eukprot:3042773-Pyramimonas_sp.AAC.1
METAPALGKLHKSIKDDPLVPIEVEVDDTMLFHPRDVIDHKSAKWRNLWCPTRDDVEEVKECFRQAKERAQTEVLPEITGDM